MYKFIKIKVLPGRMPINAVLYVYDGLKLGGFTSSLYMDVDKGSTLFFFDKDKDSLITPLDKLYDKLFSDVEFIQPK